MSPKYDLVSAVVHLRDVRGMIEQESACSVICTMRKKVICNGSRSVFCSSLFWRRDPLIPPDISKFCANLWPTKNKFICGTGISLVRYTYGTQYNVHSINGIYSRFSLHAIHTKPNY